MQNKNQLLPMGEVGQSVDKEDAAKLSFAASFPFS